MNRRTSLSALSLAVVSCFGLSFCSPAAIFAQPNRSNGKSANLIPEKPTGKATPDNAAVLATFRSKNYTLYTDLNKEQATKLLGRLEAMLKLLSTYWGAPQNGIVELYVAQDIQKWPKEVIEKLPEHGLAKMSNREGVTIIEAFGIGGKLSAAHATVYADSSRGTPEHEAVHAYCGQTFGTSGPVWYAEGMAEMGNYWREKEPGVTCSPEVVKLLKDTPEKKAMREIIDNEERTGDSWENYCWRWALCHLLVNNPNYNKEFLRLGKYLLVERKKVTFDETFGPVADQIAFEYDLFLQNFDIGYRVDLCAWDWKRKFSSLDGSASLNSRVQADRGWQPTSANVKTDSDYEYSTKGKWRISKDGPDVSPNGVENGVGLATGRLEGVILFRDEKNKRHVYQLTKPFPLGESGVLTVPHDGQLFVRCSDDWTKLDDNKGFITLTLKKKSKK